MLSTEMLRKTLQVALTVSAEPRAIHGYGPYLALLSLGTRLPEQEPQEFWILLNSSVPQAPVKYRGRVPLVRKRQRFRFPVLPIPRW